MIYDSHDVDVIKERIRKQDKAMHLGILGGTFNPVHLGHLLIAEQARERFLIDKVLFIPTALPPHKELKPFVSAEDRVRMVRIAINDNPHFELSEVEVKRQGRSYSIETLRYLKARYGEGVDLSFILGWDSFEEIVTWKDYTELFALTNFIVAPRFGYKKRPLSEVLPIEISKSFCYDVNKGYFIHRSHHFIAYLDSPLIEISATYIRERIISGRSVRYLVPDRVMEYIKSHRLYLE